MKGTYQLTKFKSIYINDGNLVHTLLTLKSCGLASNLDLKCIYDCLATYIIYIHCFYIEKFQKVIFIIFKLVHKKFKSNSNLYSC